MILLLLFAALAGAVQMIAPDRWMPASVFAWQRGFGSLKITLFALLVFSVHVVLGLGLYELMFLLRLNVPGDSLGAFTLIFLGIVGLVRAYRFSRVREVIYRSPDSRRAIYSVLSLLGPSEMVIPVLMKAKIDGVPMGLMLFSFLCGTMIAGAGVLIYARQTWNRPLALPRAVQWARSRMAAVPMAAGALIGIALLFRAVS